MATSHIEIMIFHDPEGLNKEEFLAVYKGSAEINAPQWYPDLPFEAAVQKYESGYWDFMQRSFWEEKGVLLVAHSDSHYVSAVVAYQKENHSFLIEALETAPNERGKGYGKIVLKEMLDFLVHSDSNATVYSFTGKKNIASQRTHASLGMEKLHDYWQDESGTIDNTQITYVYHN